MSAHADEYASHFDPRRYLRQYYSLPQLAADDADLFRALCGWLKETGRTYGDVLDVGCGPTIHNTFAVAPFAERIVLADYLPGNLAEVRKWLDAAPDAHDWDPLFRGVLDIEGEPADRLEARKALYRSRVSDLRHCDLRSADPVGQPDSFDLVVSFFCAECVAGSRAEWEAMMGRVLSLVRPGGAVFFAAVRECDRYEVLGRWFPSVRLVEDDFRNLLARHNFTPPTIKSESVPAPDWADHGFDHICLVSATRN